MRSLIQVIVLLAILLSSNVASVDAKDKKKKMTRKERKVEAREKAVKFANMKAAGQDQVSMTKEAAELRSYELRKKKRKGLLKRREASLAQVLFPGASPEEYADSEPVPAFVELVESKKTQLPFEFYDLPTCPEPAEKIQKRFRQRRNLGSRLMGHKLQMVSKFDMFIINYEN